MTGEPLVIDVLGLRCPIPVHHTRKALRNLPEGGVIHLLGDAPESLHDIPVLLERLGLHPAEISEAERGWVYVITNQNSQ